MTPTEAREEFRATLAALKETKARRFAQGKAIEAQLEEELEAAAVTYQKSIGKKRGKKSARSVLPVDTIDAAVAEYQGRFNRSWDLFNAEIKGLEARLLQLAPLAEIRPGELRTVYVRDPYSYATQSDAAGYARGAAEVKLEELVAAGFRFAVIERVDRIGSGGRRLPVWHVRVPLAEEIDVEIVNKLPPPSVKERIRNLLRHGINPWVTDPFLPRDILERLGLDWQGRDVAPIVAPQTT